MNNRYKKMIKNIFVAIACFLLCFIIVFGVTACGTAGEQGPKGDTGATGATGAPGAPGAAGADGEDGTTPHIGENGNWWFGDTDSGVSATGPAGEDGSAGKDGASGSGTILAPDYYRATYINAPYSLKYGQKIDDEVLEPAFFENEDHDGPRIGVTMLGVLEVQGSIALGDKANEPMYFRDINNNKMLDVFEDWRLPAEIRATAMAATLSDDQLSYNLLNQMMYSPKKTTVADVTDDDGNPVWSKLFSNTVDALRTANYRNFVVRNNPATEVGVWFNNGLEQFSEWDAIQKDETAVPFLSFTNPINHGMPSSEGVAAAALGDGNADFVLEDAQMDGRIMWAKGIDGIYGPQIDLVTDPRWSRNNTTYGERVDMVEEIARNLTIGYQNGDKGMVEGSVLLTVKHFPGDGAAYNGFESHGNAGKYRIYQTKDSLANYQLKPFIAAFEAGAAGVMPGYSQPSDDVRNASQSITYNGKTHDILFSGYGNAFNESMTALLRDVLGFEGLINSDSVSTNNAHGVNQYGDNLTPLEQTVLFVKNCDAGVFSAGGAMGGMSLRPELIAEALSEGLVTRAELRRAAYYRLKPRAQTGDLDNPYRDMAESVATVNTLTPRVAELAEETHLKSVVLMKNANNTLPLKEADKTKKIYTRSYGKDATSSALSGNNSFEAALTALGYATFTTDVAEADIAYLRMSPATPSNPGAGNHPLWVPDLGSFETPVYGPDAVRTDETQTIHTVRTIDEFKATAAAVRAKGGKVIGEIIATNAWVLKEMEPYCDALIGSTGSSQAAIAKVVTGGYNPTGKLPITMIADQSVVAVVPTKFSNGETWDICVSPNDVPGYDKDKYMSATVLAASPSGSYAYKDSAGNFYRSGFGLTY